MSEQNKISFGFQKRLIRVAAVGSIKFTYLSLVSANYHSKLCNVKKTIIFLVNLPTSYYNETILAELEDAKPSVSHKLIKHMHGNRWLWQAAILLFQSPLLTWNIPRGKRNTVKQLTISVIWTGLSCLSFLAVSHLFLCWDVRLGNLSYC